MGNITLSMPEEVLKKMKMFKEVRWSEVARRAIEQRVSDLEVMEKIASKSKLTKDDAKALADKINSNIARKLKIR